MQMVGALSNAMLFLSCQAIFTAPADTRSEADANEITNIDARATVLPEFDDPAHAFVAAYMRGLDGSNGLAVGACCYAFFGMEVCDYKLARGKVGAVSKAHSRHVVRVSEILQIRGCTIFCIGW